VNRHQVISYADVLHHLSSVFARHHGQDRLQFHQLPSLLRGISRTSSWEITAGFNIQDFAFDPEQDILIALEQT
jgi:hypothetical protein